MAHQSTDDPALAEARRALVDAEAEYRQMQSEEYVTRDIRDAAIGAASRAGISSSEISRLVGDIGQPNVVRARRRAFARRDIVPDGLLSPTDALRHSGLGAKEFIAMVRNGQLQPIALPGGVRAFRPEDIERLGSTA